jgi:RHS repeat-associated protein
VLEYSPAGAIVGRNLYGKAIDEILMRTDPTVNSGQPFYYQQDHKGSVTHLTNVSGAVIEKYRYDAFGAPTFYNGSGTQIGSSAYKNRFLFTGREYASTFSFYEYRARACDPTLGWFMSEDPKLFDAGDYNLFRYCGNDPIDFTDPMGLDYGDLFVRLTLPLAISTRFTIPNPYITTTSSERACTRTFRGGTPTPSR